MFWTERLWGVGVGTLSVKGWNNWHKKLGALEFETATPSQYDIFEKYTNGKFKQTQKKYIC
jgi:hypothetical protein